LAQQPAERLVMNDIARVGFKLAHEPACVLITNILASAGE